MRMSLLFGHHGCRASEAGCSFPNMRPPTCPVRALPVALFCCTFMISMARLIAADETNRQPLTVKEILTHMAGVYVNCRAYCDTGLVSTTFTQRGHTQSDQKVFATAFVRPNRFRFEFSGKSPDKQALRCIVWRQGREVRIWWSPNRDAQKPSARKPSAFGNALAAATGVSGGAAHTIPALLLPNEIGGQAVTNIVAARRMADCKPLSRTLPPRPAKGSIESSPIE